MKRTKILILLVLIISISSCSTLRKTSINNEIINLTPENKELLNGLYDANSLLSQDSIKGDLYWNIFDRGYNKTDTIEYFEFKAIDHQKLLVNHYDGNSIVRSKVFKGKYKNGYFQFKRRWLVIPAIFVNLCRNRMFRVGVLKNGNIVTDYNQISLGTFYIIIPFFEHQQKYNIEFEELKE